MEQLKRRSDFYLHGEALMAKAKRQGKYRRGKNKKEKKKVVAKSALRAKARKPQRFTASHHRDEDFDYGLRPYSAYRDLGIARRPTAWFRRTSFG